MNTAALDAIRLEANSRLDPRNKSSLGQFMTPSNIAEFMASLFDDPSDEVTLMDCGAGIGSLTVAAVKRLGKVKSVEQWEIDPIMRGYLADNNSNLDIAATIHTTDFIEEAVKNIALDQGGRFTHAILNPPYRKISSDSEHRLLLRKVGVETVNLYTAFLALTILLMKDQGQVIAIIPRSFCNGPYYKAFRNLMLKHCSIEHIHVFESRDSAFKDDDVLQENIIIKLVKGKKSSMVTVTSCEDHHLADIKALQLSFEKIVKPKDAEQFIHIPLNDLYFEDNKLFQDSLSDLGLQVSTGPIVDFRMRNHLLSLPMEGSVPLLYPHHFVNGAIQYPKEHKKLSNAVALNDETRKWFWDSGWYVLVKRFSSKEEPRRVVAFIVNPDEIDSELIGFENCWNVFHVNKKGLGPVIAKGLACFLNSTLLDSYFRVFSGHTQVNATDLKNMRYPSVSALKELGKQYQPGMNQNQIDELILRKK